MALALAEVLDAWRRGTGSKAYTGSLQALAMAFEPASPLHALPGHAPGGAPSSSPGLPAPALTAFCCASPRDQGTSHQTCRQLGCLVLQRNPCTLRVTNQPAHQHGRHAHALPRRRHGRGRQQGHQVPGGRRDRAGGAQRDRQCLAALGCPGGASSRALAHDARSGCCRAARAPPPSLVLLGACAPQAACLCLPGAGRSCQVLPGEMADTSPAVAAAVLDARASLLMLQGRKCLVRSDM